jgi:hypothetical protein
MRLCHWVSSVLGRRLVECQINGAGSRAAVQPTIGIHANRFAGKVLEIAWLLDRLEEWQKPCVWVSIVLTDVTAYQPEMPIVYYLPLTRRGKQWLGVFVIRSCWEDDRGEEDL